MTAGAAAYAVLSAVVFPLGLYGVLTRTTLASTLMALAVLFLAPVIALAGFAQAGGNDGSGGALALIAVFAAAAEIAVGIGIALLVRRRIASGDIEDLVGLED
jgi:NADH-quinone oxidoreductase subunit K